MYRSRVPTCGVIAILLVGGFTLFAAMCALTGVMIVKFFRNENPSAFRIACLTGHSNAIQVLAFSPDSDLLASGGADSAIIIWRVSKLAEEVRLTSHRNEIASLAFSPDGKLLASTDWSCSVYLWDTTTWQSRCIFQGQSVEPSAAVFSPDGATLAYGPSHKRGSVTIWDTKTERVSWDVDISKHSVRGLAYLNNGKNLIAIDEPGNAFVYDTATHAIIESHSISLNTPNPDFRILASRPETGDFATAKLGGSSVMTWSSGRAMPSAHFDADKQEGVTGITFTSDGNGLVTASGSVLIHPGNLRVWSLDS